MKISKKIIILSLMVIGSCKNIDASASQRPSFLTQACSVVSFKTTLGLGLGLVGVAAYCWYKVPQLEAQLAKAKYLDEPVMKESMVGNAERDLALLKVLQSKIDTALSSPSKFDDDKKDFFTDLAKELDKLCMAPIKEVQSFLVNTAQNYVDYARKKIVYLAGHACTDLCKEACNSDKKNLLKDDEQICNILKVLQKKCCKDIETLNVVKSVQQHKKEHVRLVKEHEKEKQRVARINKPISIARTNLHNSIAWYENIQLPCGIAGISLALITGIGKYCNR